MADQKFIRRCANYQPSLWSDEYIQSLNSEYKEELFAKRNGVLKEEARGTLCKLVDHVDQLEMIDILQRLGVSYHFDNEIRNILENVHNNMDTLEKKENLHVTALAFRLLRQHRFNISTDVFASFHDTMGNFKSCLLVDIAGLLSLYEASFHSYENEPILDEARYFTTNILEEFVNTNRESEISLLINHALEFPLHWTLPRMEALWFIKFLSKRRRNVSRALIEFAEMDYNIIQSIHQEELKSTSRWWKRTGLVEERNFFRDRLMENFLWSLDMNFKPELGYYRNVMTKTNSFLTIIDDIYDVYGTLEELQLFTDAIESWDLNVMDNLPHYMKVCFLALHNFVNEVAFVSLKKNGYNIIPYLHKLWADICKAYFTEAKWYYNKHIPRLQEYMGNAWISIPAPIVLMHAYFLLSTSLKKEDLVCFEEYPNIIQSSSIICRIVNDLGTSKREMVAGDVSNAIQCYMNETGASEIESREHLRCMMHQTWKKMNEEALINSPFSENFIYAILNLVRAAMLFYHHGDGFTNPEHGTKSRIHSLIMQPFSVLSK